MLLCLPWSKIIRMTSDVVTKLGKTKPLRFGVTQSLCEAVDIWSYPIAVVPQEGCGHSDMIDVGAESFTGANGSTPPADDSRLGREGRRVGHCAKAGVVVNA